MDLTAGDLRIIHAALSNIHKATPVAPEVMPLFVETCQKIYGYLTAAEAVEKSVTKKTANGTEDKSAGPPQDS
mgnify:FL=1